MLPAWGWSIEEISPPCDPAAPPPADTSESRTTGVGGLRFCSLSKPKILAELKNRIAAQISGVPSVAEGYYGGCDIDPNFVGPVTPGSCQGKPFPGPVCNRIAGPFNGNQAEEVSNHRGVSCGNFAGFKTQKIVIGTDPDTGLNSYRCKISRSHQGTSGTREDAYLRGAWVRALTCAHSQVRSEVETQGSLKLSEVGGVAGPCAAMAPLLDPAARTVKKIFTDLKQSLSQEGNLKDIDHCETIPVVDSVSLDPGERRQSACTLASARAMLETMFAQVSTCEVFYRAQLKYDAFIASAAPVLRKIDISGCVKSRVLDTDQCTDSFVRDTCYVPTYLNELNARMNAFWPSGSCS